MSAIMDSKNQASVSRGKVSANTIVFIDSAVEQIESLMAGVRAGTQGIILNNLRSGIEQIAEVLASQTGISEIHIVSHGSPGLLQLGNTTLSWDTVDAYSSLLQTWAKALTCDAGILLYGCSVAADNIGEAFIQRLSELTGAVVAGSAKPTGSAEKGGNWELEYTTGQLKASLAFETEVMANYNGVLGFSLEEVEPSTSDGIRFSDTAGNFYKVGGEPPTILTKYDEAGTQLWSKDVTSEGFTYIGYMWGDSANNIYLTNNTQIAKYDSNGNLQSVPLENTINNSVITDLRDFSKDSSGNIYFFASTNGAVDGSNAGGSEVVLIKYNSLGREWVKQLASAEIEEPNQTVTDSAGNVYIITGSSNPWIAKYDSLGNQQMWVQLSGNIPIESYTSFGVDDSGNIYLSGNTEGNMDGTNVGQSDIWAAKYDPSGNQQWVKQWGTVWNDTTYGKAAIDSEGNIYIPCDSDTLFNQFSPGIASRVIKYDTLGNQKWVAVVRAYSNDYRLPPYPTSVAVNSAGQVYVSGRDVPSDPFSIDPSDWWTTEIVQTNTAPTVLYNTGLSLEKGATAAITSHFKLIDAENDTFFTYTLTAAPATGTLTLNGTALGVNSTFTQTDLDAGLLSYTHNNSETTDDSISFSATDGNGGDISEIAFEITLGGLSDPPWLSQFGTNRTEESSGVAVDSDGSLYVSGHTWGEDDDYIYGRTGEAWIAKYDSLGNTQWLKQLGGGFTNGVATDSDGSVYVAGQTREYTSPRSPTRATLGKYDSSGNQLWNYLGGGVAFLDVAVDSAGNVYTSGYYGDGSNDTYPLVGKYDSQGNQLWLNKDAREEGSENRLRGKVSGVAVDNAGNVFASGYGLAVDGRSDYSGADIVIKYDSQGNQLWLKAVGDGYSSTDIATDSAGNIYATGITEDSTNKDIWIAKYDTNGTQLWIKQLGTIGGSNSQISVDSSSGNVYLSGTIKRNADGTNAGETGVWTAIYDPNGNQLWVEQLGTGTNYESSGIIAGSNNTLYLSGNTSSAATKDDPWVAKLIAQPISVPNNAPTLNLNTGLTLDEGTSSTITSAQLQVSDPDSDPISYTLTAVPTSGTLTLNGTALSVSSTFTQADLNAGLLIYTHAGSETTSDSFSFSITDGKGGNIDSTAFAITVSAGPTPTPIPQPTPTPGEGNDTLTGSDSNDTLTGSDANDSLSGMGGNDILIGAVGNDNLVGNDGNDLLFGNVGNDLLDGGNGDDTLFGGKDSDTLVGMAGQDILMGDIGNDNLAGNDGNDLLFGNVGNDLLDGGAGSDTVFGGKDADTLSGNTDEDILLGDFGNDSLNGGAGNDLLFGNIGADYLDGVEGNDTLFAGKENDIVMGGDGDDLLSGDLGNDTLTGNAGTDRFVLMLGAGVDTITDFEDGIDLIALTGTLTFESLTISQSNNATLITAGEELLASLNGVEATLIGVGDFALI
jgi:Ca2+-binding RTX toxin-like protein